MYSHTYSCHHFFVLLLLTLSVSLEKLPKLDFGLCCGGACLETTPLAALKGLGAGVGTSGNAFSLVTSLALWMLRPPSSVALYGLEARLAFSWTLLNFSSSSPHRIAFSSRTFKRPGRSKAAVGVWGGLTYAGLASYCGGEGVTWATYARGAI